MPQPAALQHLKYKSDPRASPIGSMPPKGGARFSRHQAAPNPCIRCSFSTPDTEKKTVLVLTRCIGRRPYGLLPPSWSKTDKSPGSGLP